MKNREQCIIDNIPLVKSIASKFNVSNIGIDYDDLVSIGVIGLMNAYDKYDKDKGKFSTYATIRIKSYMIDEIRKLSPITRTDMKKIKEYNSNVDILNRQLKREPTSTELSNSLGVSIHAVKAIEDSINVLNIVSIDAVVGGTEDTLVTLKDMIEGDDSSPSDVLLEEEKITMLAECLDMLNNTDRLILFLYYYEELTLREVGLVVGLSESRVSILHRRALVRLKDILKILKYNYIEECVV